jgi:hypothetical protein
LPFLTPTMVAKIRTATMTTRISMACGFSHVSAFPRPGLIARRGKKARPSSVGCAGEGSERRRKVMKVVSKLKLQVIAVVALALLAVPVAQAKDIALRSFQSGQAKTAQGLKADGLRLQALAHAYQSQQGESAQGLKADGLRMQALANAYREQGAGGTATVAPYSTALSYFVGQEASSEQVTPSGSYTKGTVLQNTTSYPFATASVASYPEDRQVAVQMRRDAQKLIKASAAVAPVAHTGFNWNDAGIGAGIAALAVVLAGLGAGGIVRKRAAHA